MVYFKKGFIYDNFIFDGILLCVVDIIEPDLVSAYWYSTNGLKLSEEQLICTTDSKYQEWIEIGEGFKPSN